MYRAPTEMRKIAYCSFSYIKHTILSAKEIQPLYVVYQKIQVQRIEANRTAGK